MVSGYLKVMQPAYHNVESNGKGGETMTQDKPGNSNLADLQSAYNEVCNAYHRIDDFLLCFSACCHWLLVQVFFYC